MAKTAGTVAGTDRATWKAQVGAHVTHHTCASPECPRPNTPITVKELTPIVIMVPHKHTVFYHRACAPVASGMAGR